jgi:glycosyltransferase involved in cell wall biosynthesis
MITDIVLCTRNRLPLLKRTLTYLFERTTTPFRLHVIDDASTEGNAEYLQGLKTEGKLSGLVLRSNRTHIRANWSAVSRMAQSDILVYSDDDILCPKLSPDWLSRGLAAMARYHKLGLLALHLPTAPIKVIRQEGPVTLCDRVGSHLAFIRRDLMRSIVIPPVGGMMEKIVMQANAYGIDRAWSRAVWSRGYWVAYLTGVYCQHIGLRSGRTGHDLRSRDVTLINADTLEPLAAMIARTARRGH